MRRPAHSDDVHVGRDPNDTTWVVVRYPEDYAPYEGAPVLRDVVHSPARGALELAGAIAPGEHRRAFPRLLARVNLAIGEDTLSLAQTTARAVRVGDTLRLGESTAATVQTLGAATVTASVAGARVAYGSGSVLRLIRRNGAPLPGAPAIRTLASDETIDLSSVPVGTGAATISFPHSSGALLHVGDVVQLSSGGTWSELTVSNVTVATTVKFAPALAAAVLGEVRLVDTPGRVFTEDLPGLVQPAPVGQRLVIRSGTSRAWADVILAELDLGALWVDPSRLTGPVTFANWESFRRDEPEWHPLEPATGPEGDAYRSDPGADRILRRGCGDGDWLPLEGIGGRGSATGQLRRPLGVALDGRGFLYVADSENHRVQVVRTDGSGVVTVLGRVDGWGAPLAGESGGAMREPVDVAVGPCDCAIYVADREAGRIHVFDGRFRYVRSFSPRPDVPPANFRPRPVGLVVASDGTLLIADLGWPRLLHATPEGEPLPEVVARAGEYPHFAGLQLLQAFSITGTAVFGPLDGRVHGAAWHQIAVDAELPAGTAIEVQTFASNTPALDPERAPWAPEQPVPIPLPREADEDGAYRRLVLSDTASGTRYQHGPYPRARPRLATFGAGAPEGTGPSAGAGQATLDEAALRKVRAGDTVCWVAGTTVHTATVTAVDAATVTVFAQGRPTLFGPGAELSLLQREGRPVPGAPRIHTLASGESLDLRVVDTAGLDSTFTMPHALAALLRVGDVVRLAAGDRALQLEVLSVTLGQRLSFAPVAPVSFATSRLSLETTPGRLMARDLDGFELPPPPGMPVRISTQLSPPNDVVTATVRLAEPDTGALWLESAVPSGLPDAWVSFVTAAPSTIPSALSFEPTDRGRYLWIKLRLRGALASPAAKHAEATPTVRSVRALLQRPSLLAYLPQTFARRDDQEDPPGALFLERYLTLFERVLTRVESRAEAFSRLANPQAAPSEWLSWLATWINLAFDPSWPLEKRRAVMAEATELYRRRGTREGLRRWLELYLGEAPELVEGFQTRRRPGVVLGQAVLGCSLLANKDETEASCDVGSWASHAAHRLTLYVYLSDDLDPEAAQSSVRAIVQANVPAHVAVDLRFVRANARVGIRSQLGLDLVLAEDPRPSRAALGQSSAPGQATPWLGQTLFLGSEPRPARRAPPSLGNGARLDLTLD